MKVAKLDTIYTTRYANALHCQFLNVLTEYKYGYIIWTNSNSIEGVWHRYEKTPAGFCRQFSLKHTHQEVSNSAFSGVFKLVSRYDA